MRRARHVLVSASLLAGAAFVSLSGPLFVPTLPGYCRHHEHERWGHEDRSLPVHPCVLEEDVGVEELDRDRPLAQRHSGAGMAAHPDDACGRALRRESLAREIPSVLRWFGGGIAAAVLVIAALTFPRRAALEGEVEFLSSRVSDERDGNRRRSLVQRLGEHAIASEAARVALSRIATNDEDASVRDEAARAVGLGAGALSPAVAGPEGRLSDTEAGFLTIERGDLESVEE